MANRVKRGSEAVPYTHVQGEVALATSIPPALKDALVDLARAEGAPLKVVVRRALEREVSVYLGIPEAA